MRIGGRDHGLIQRMRKTRAARTLALVVAAVAGLAQFSALWHEAVVQHVRCVEHGELTHVTALGATASPHAPDRTRSSVDASQSGEPDGHEHCAVAFTVQGGAHAPVARTAVRLAPPPAVARPASAPAPRPGRGFVLASAPKTSPPCA